MRLLILALLLAHSSLHAQENYNQKSQSSRSDLENIEVGGGLDILVGGLVNTFNGNTQNFLGVGGGIKVDVILMGERKFGMGMDMSIYGNHLKTKYPIASSSKQNSTQPTIVIGLACHWIVRKSEKRQISLQFEANYAQQNVSKQIYIADDEVYRFTGFSPGILVHYMIKAGHDKLKDYYKGTVVVRSWINFHAGIRPLLYNSALGNGAMLEMGISYRMKSNFINY